MAMPPTAQQIKNFFQNEDSSNVDAIGNAIAFLVEEQNKQRRDRVGKLPDTELDPVHDELLLALTVVESLSRRPPGPSIETTPHLLAAASRARLRINAGETPSPRRPPFSGWELTTFFTGLASSGLGVYLQRLVQGDARQGLWRGGCLGAGDEQPGHLVYGSGDEQVRAARPPHTLMSLSKLGGELARHN
ncbi:hypothetical protein KFL_000270030 [Klebsormidium nitens]|uniref:Uncharacterized protein n=1 Tax=Klebsormidium nitens TaxID=105231 RepID=A0A1Y1HKV7_KLENI|nr:hypothetical protein KFL_000270030 [Klebsormidium nitens]|eukprot:GAQ79244.1 hypothetical protein KFL_000270030 [Klebsormidium nitens]